MSLDRYKNLRILIGIVDDGVWRSRFGRCLRNLEFAVRNYRIGEYKTQHLRTMVTTGSIIPKSRLECLKAAKAMDADYLLYVDTDQTFPRNTIHRLIQHKLDVVGANIAIKKIPSQPTARGEPAAGELYGPPIFTDPESKGLQEVWRIGTGLLMLSKKAFSALPHSCLEMRYVEAIDDYQGEDWSLCEALREAGFKIFIDHDLSKEVGHLGEFEFTHDVVGDLSYVGSAEPRQTEAAEEVGG
jgi:hypothetical protein